jgi:hypothetical protein
VCVGLSVGEELTYCEALHLLYRPLYSRDVNTCTAAVTDVLAEE